MPSFDSLMALLFIFSPLSLFLHGARTPARFPALAAVLPIPNLLQLFPWPMTPCRPFRLPLESQLSLKISVSRLFFFLVLYRIALIAVQDIY
ncbi:hypothetical protein V8C40DRAFT_249793 [Trichoderma camerunense]